MVYIALGLMVPLTVIFLTLYLVYDDPFWLGPLVLAAGSITVALVMIRGLIGSERAFTSKAYDGRPMEIVERIQGALVEAGVQFEREESSVGKVGLPTIGTFVIGEDDVTIDVIDRLGFGVTVLVGPMTEFNRTTIEKYQGIIDSVKEGEVTLFGTS